LRTETTINNPYDFGVGRRLKSLTALGQIGMAANHRVLEVERMTQDSHIGTDPGEILGLRGSRKSAEAIGGVSPAGSR